jgi:signal transduction histidine kinase
MIRSLRVKLILSHLAVIFVAMTVASFLLLSMARGYFLAAMEQSLVAQAHLIVQALIPGATAALQPEELPSAYNTVQQQQASNISVQVGSNAPPSDGSAVSGATLAEDLERAPLAYLNEASVELSAMLETRIRVLDEQGVVLVDSAGGDEGRDLSEEAAVVAALRGEQQAYQRMTDGEDWLFVSMPLLVEEQVAGVVYLGQPLRDVAAVLSDLRWRLLLAAAVALPLSALVGLALARTIAQPVRALTAAAGRLANGDFDYPLRPTGQDELGQLSRTFIAMRDRLQAVERMRAQFVSDVSHELRTPLTAVKGSVETLRGGAVDDPMARERFLVSIESETERLIRLVNDLLILSRADAQALTLRRRSVDLRTVVRSTTDKLTPRLVAKGLHLTVELPDTPLTTSADPDRVEQVLVNLLDNALKHTPTDGKVAVVGHELRVEGGRTEWFGCAHHRPLASSPPLPDGGWAILSVADTGEGIPAADLPHVFERFYRADRSRSRERGGSGLGLSIAKALVEAHGGHIWLESTSRAGRTGEGKSGTTASFALPLLAPPQSPPTLGGKQGRGAQFPPRPGLGERG